MGGDALSPATCTGGPLTHRLGYVILCSRYASLFFCFGIDWNDNELSGLEVLHKYVECLDQYFGNVCELDIIYNYSAVRVFYKRYIDY